MPNPEQLQRAAERREARKMAQQDAVVKANTQDQEQIGAAAPEAKMDAAEVVRQQVKPRTNNERKKMQQEAVAKAVLEQDLTPTPDALKGYVHVPGVVPPLHIQNALARQATEAFKDEARELAQAVGRKAFEIATDTGGRGQHSRWKKLRRADDIARSNQAAQK